MPLAASREPFSRIPRFQNGVGHVHETGIQALAPGVEIAQPIGEAGLDLFRQIGPIELLDRGTDLRHALKDLPERFRLDAAGTFIGQAIVHAEAALHRDAVFHAEAAERG